MNLNTFFQSKKFIWLAGGIFSAIILLLVFQLGMYVGYRKAAFSFRWGDNYHRVFGGPKEGFLRDVGGRDLINGHGMAGEILSISGQDLVVKGPDNVEKAISASDTLVVRKGWQTLKFSDLKVGDRIVAIGAPKDDGSVSANFIRVFDPTEPFGPEPPGGPRPALPDLNKKY